MSFLSAGLRAESSIPCNIANTASAPTLAPVPAPVPAPAPATSSVSSIGTFPAPVPAPSFDYDIAPNLLFASIIGPAPNPSSQELLAPPTTWRLREKPVEARTGRCSIHCVAR